MRSAHLLAANLKACVQAFPQEAGAAWIGEDGEAARSWHHVGALGGVASGEDVVAAPLNLVVVGPGEAACVAHVEQEVPRVRMNFRRYNPCWQRRDDVSVEASCRPSCV